MKRAAPKHLVAAPADQIVKRSLTTRTLAGLTTEAFGGTGAERKWTWQPAFRAMQAAAIPKDQKAARPDDALQRLHRLTTTALSLPS